MAAIIVRGHGPLLPLSIRQTIGCVCFVEAVYEPPYASPTTRQYLSAAFIIVELQALRRQSATSTPSAEVPLITPANLIPASTPAATRATTAAALVLSPRSSWLHP